jgi:hypothetical protein
MQVGPSSLLGPLPLDHMTPGAATQALAINPSQRLLTSIQPSSQVHSQELWEAFPLAIWVSKTQLTHSLPSPCLHLTSNLLLYVLTQDPRCHVTSLFL